MKLRRKKRESKGHAGAWAICVLVLVAGLFGVRAVHGALSTLSEWTSDLPEINAESFEFAKDSYMYASDGTTLLAKFQLEKRDPIELKDICDYVVDGTIDVEDIRFYEHNGVDYVAIVRAAVNNLLGGRLEGASTISQQLVRNTALSEEANEISFRRKAREAELALQLEERYSKEEILSMYLNTINYGDGCYGIQAAAQNYFQTDASDLSLAQAATLVGIPQSPTAFNPKEYPQSCLDRRNTVLARMLDAGDITQEQYDEATAEPLNLDPAEDEPMQGIYAYPYFTSFVRDKLLETDNEFGCSYAQLFEGGLKIYTTLDPNMQDKADGACADQQGSMDAGMDAALVAIDPRNGYVRAMVGGNDFYADQWNIAVQGGRPSGSTFKAFTLTAAIESGISPKTAIDCSSPVTLSTGQTISNFGGATYGKKTLADTTAISSNTGYYRLADRLGADKIIDVAHRMGITSELSPYPIITLGTENVTLLEMAEAYSTLATGGIHRKYVIITRIEDASGNVLYENADEPERVLDEKVAGAVTDVLRGVFEKSYATAYGSGPSNGQPVAGKTGTGVEYRDHWLVGYCPQLTCAAWIGNRDYSSTSAYLTANSLWHDFMSRALDGIEIEGFPAVEAPVYTNKNEELDEEKERKEKEEREKKEKEEKEKAEKAEKEAKEKAEKEEKERAEQEERERRAAEQAAAAADVASNFKPGSMAEGELADRFPDYEKRVSYEFSQEFMQGSIISLTLNEETKTFEIVVSKGKPA